MKTWAYNAFVERSLLLVVEERGFMPGGSRLVYILHLAFCVSLDELVDGFSLEAITRSSSGDRIINLVVICI